MANRERGEVSLVVGDRTYTLILTANAMCEVEDLLSTDKKTVSFSDVLTQVGRQSIRAIRALVWGATREHHSEMTLEEVGDLIQDLGGVIAFAEKLDSLVVSMQPDAADVAAAAEVQGKRPLKAQAKRDGTGDGSTSTPVASA